MMPIPVRYHCNNCGHEFTVDTLTEEEKQEARQRNQPTYRIHFPKCNRIDNRKISN